MLEGEGGKQHTCTCYISREGVWSDEASCDDHLFATDSQYYYDSSVETDTSRSIKKESYSGKKLSPNKFFQYHLYFHSLMTTDLQVFHG